MAACPGSVIDAEVISASDRRPGVKQRLVSVLEGLERPISAGELWDLCKVLQTYVAGLLAVVIDAHAGVPQLIHDQLSLTTRCCQLSQWKCGLIVCVCSQIRR